MGYVYSDAEMLIASKLSYLDIPAGTNISEWMASCEESYAANTGICAGGKEKMEAIQLIRDIVANNNIQGFENWRVVDVNDRNAKTGFYASVYDTGSGDAIIGFRGSESFDKFSNIVNDWIESDLGLLNATLTPQQEDASDYMRYIYEQYGDKYSTFSTAGHSLGGNLAQHAVYSAPDAMRDKIDHGISFDGPGFSDEYLALHANEIRKSSGSVSHYEWSFVGSLLNQPEGTDDRVIMAQDDPDAKGQIASFEMGEFVRHDIKNMAYYLEDGHVVEGQRGALQVIMSNASKILDSDGLLSMMIYLTVAMDFREINPLTKVIITVGVVPFTKVIKPIYNAIDIIHRIVYNSQGLIDKASREIQDLNDWIRELSEQIWFDHFGPQVSGEFEVDLPVFSSATDSLAKLNNKIHGIISEVEGIELSMAFNAHSSRILQAAVFSTKTALELDCGAVNHLGAMCSEIAGIYSEGEQKVVSLFDSMPSTDS